MPLRANIGVYTQPISFIGLPVVAVPVPQPDGMPIAVQIITAPWREDVGSDWTRFPIARLHYTKTTGLWALYWRDRNLKYHRYQPLEPSPQTQDLLDYLDSGADPIFWG